MRKAKSNLHLEENSVKFYLSFVSLSKGILNSFWLTKGQRQGDCVYWL